MPKRKVLAVDSAWAATATLAKAAAAQRESFQFMTSPVSVEAMKIDGAAPAPASVETAGTAGRPGTRQRESMHAKYRLKVYYRL